MCPDRPGVFLPREGGSTREAKKVCTGCDVKGDCLEYALAHDERFGIWGGLSERERRRLEKPSRLTVARLGPFGSLWPLRSLRLGPEVGPAD